MAIRAQHCYLVINCFVFIPYLLAKPFSLNEAIAEEVRGKQSLQTTPRSKSADTFEAILKEKQLPLLSTNRILSAPYQTKDYSGALKKNTPAVQYRKTFKIRTPLKPKKLKSQQKLLNRLRNKTAKRAVDSHEVINRKYIPLFKSLSVLFDNFLNPDTSESYETTRHAYRGNYEFTNDADEPECACAFKPNTIIRTVNSSKTTAAPAKTFATTISYDEIITSTEVATTASDNTATGHIRSIERNKNIPVLLTRNTSSRGRDDNGVGEGSSSTNYGSIERYLAGDFGNNQCDTRSAENAPVTQHYEKHSSSATRDYASSNGSFRRISRNRNYPRNPKIRRPIGKNYSISTEEKSYEKLGRYFDILKGENKHQTRGYKTKSATPLPNFYSGLRRYTDEDETEITESTATGDNYEEAIFNVTFNSTDDKRFLDRNGTDTPENQKLRPTDEAVTSSMPFHTIAPVKHKVPVVTIFDGYSVARDVNGDNRLTEKAIHIHT